VRSAPEIIWPGALRLRLLSEVSYWVVYSEPEHAICIEPMTGPPNALNLGPIEVRPGQPLVANLRLQWEAL
jgi:aldose 1-epimerase